MNIAKNNLVLQEDTQGQKYYGIKADEPNTTSPFSDDITKDEPDTLYDDSNKTDIISELEKLLAKKRRVYKNSINGHADKLESYNIHCKDADNEAESNYRKWYQKAKSAIYDYEDGLIELDEVYSLIDLPPVAERDPMMQKLIADYKSKQKAT